MREHDRDDERLAESPAPALSLLMPIYNMERYLPESLASACAQTLSDFEIV